MIRQQFQFLMYALLFILVLVNVSNSVAQQVTTVSIVDLSTDKIVYDPGENVTVNILLRNSGEARSLIMSSLIKSYWTNVVVDGMPLKILHNVVEEVSLSMIWNSRGFPIGDYYVEVMLNDTYGRLLDRRTCGFRLGEARIDVTKFSVEPRHFELGDHIQISLEALNNGSISLSGSCIFSIQKEGYPVWGSYHNFSSLAPGALLKFTSIWDASSAEKGALYYVIGYVLYESQATSPLMVTISTNYSPIARFSYTPVKVGLGEDVTFDASTSGDPDGSVSSYKWDFGDGGQGLGVKVNHAYHGLEDYVVTLTVTDDEGAVNTTRQVVRVVMMYNLNVSTNIGFPIEGSGKYKEGDEVTLTAPSSVSMPGVLGLLGAKYIFKQWTGDLNTSESSVKLVFAGYVSTLEMKAVYDEDFTALIFIGLAAAAIIVVVVVGLFWKRRGGKENFLSKSLK